MPNTRRAGVVLVLLSGLVALLLFLAVLFLRMAGASKGMSDAKTQAVLARLAAEGGLSYAAARLGESPYPGRRTIEGRGDDWTERRGAGIRGQGSDNPSYSHGEAWTDVEIVSANGADDDGNGLVDESGEGGEWKGAYAPGEPRGPDLDGDGRHSARTGRLRGGAARWIPFSVRVECAEGKIPLNAGFVRSRPHPNGVDDDEDGVVDNPEEADRNFRNPASVRPDPSDPGFPYHQGIAHAVNNLGAALLPAGHPRRWEVPTGDLAPERVTVISWLGWDLIAARPEGGYRSWEEAERRIVSLGLGYAKGDLDAVRPFVSLGLRASDGETRRGPNAESGGPTPRLQELSAPYAPVSFWGAPRTVLEALWRHLGYAAVAASLPGDPAGWDRPCERSAGAVPYRSMAILLFPDEALALAHRLDAFRGARRRGWRAFYRDLLEGAEDGSLFAKDFDDLSGYPESRRRWCQAKADLAFQAVAIDAYPCGNGVPADCLTTWGSWGIDRDRTKGGLQTWCPLGSGMIGRHLHPKEHDPADPASFSRSWGADPYRPYKAVASSTMLAPQGLTMAPPALFEIESIARAPGGGGAPLLSASVRVAERIELACQEDFEGWEKGAALAPRGISILEDLSPAARHDQRKEQGGEVPAGESPRTCPHVVTLPGRNQWSVTTSTDIPSEAFSRRFGAVTLAPREAGQRGAQLYWPLSEDFDGQAAWCTSHLAPPPWPPPPAYPVSTEFWSIEGAGYPPPDLLTQYAFGPFVFYVERTANYRTLHRPLFADQGYTTPFKTSAPWAAGSVRVECPGLYEAEPDPFKGKLKEMSMEAWISPPATFAVTRGGLGRKKAPSETSGNGARSDVLKLKAERGIVNGVAGTIYTVTVDWRGVEGQGKDDRAVGGRRYFIRDGAEPAREVWGHHAVLSVWRKAIETDSGVWLYETVADLYVDGEEACPLASDWVVTYDPLGVPQWGFAWGPWGPPGGPMRVKVANIPTFSPFSPPKWDYENIFGSGVDEVRLYNRTLSRTEAASRHGLGRFCRVGTYASPRYAFDSDASFLEAEWTGMLPEGFPPGALEVRAFGYDADGNDVWGPSGVPLGPSGAPADLSQLPPARSIRYRVLLDATPVPGALDDTPVFESVWLSFRRRGRAPAWHGWSSR